ncbi:MAG: RHS repeat-associated core domain-containing protein, partial [Gemmatimonadota bacterium]
GNRVKMSDPVLDDFEVVYHYDLENPGLYGSANNRLMYSERFDISTGTPELISTTYYYYNEYGNVTRVVTKQAEPDPEERRYAATWLKYAANGVAVTFAIGERWDWDGIEHHCPTNYTIDYAREFWYDGPRQRYLNRELDPVALLDNQMVALSETWSDYDGDNIYNDFSLDGADVTVLRSFELGIARVENPLDLPNRDPYYYHTDRLGTTRGLTRSSSEWVDESTYSAFGELVDGANHRYGYAGSSGYQAHPECSYLHVRWRYYDPLTGRFLQRDPIGVDGGFNVYAYASAVPTAVIDPSGCGWWYNFKVKAAKAFIWGTGGRDSWLDDPVKVADAQRTLEITAEVSLTLACGVYGASRLSAVRGFRWLNKGRYFRIGSSRYPGGEWNRRIVIGGRGQRVHWHIPVTRSSPIGRGGIPR